MNKGLTCGDLWGIMWEKGGSNMLLTVKQVCQKLQISRWTLANWERQGKIKRIKMGDTVIRYDEIDIQRFLDDSKTGG
jgi:excisionase family DNA binding protein